MKKSDSIKHPLSGPAKAPRASILLVEADIVFAVASTKVLSESGYKVDLVHDAEKAIAVMSEGRDIALVIVDTHLGDDAMSGIQAAEEILLLRDVPVIFVASHISEDVKQRLKGIPNYGCFEKASGLTGIIKEIEQALDSFRNEKFGVNTVLHDIKEEDEERDAQEWMRLVPQESMWSQFLSDAIIITDNNLVIRNMNKAAADIYGWSQHEAVGRDIDELLGTEFLDVTQLDAQVTLAEKGVWRGLVQQRNRRGDVLYIEASVTFLKSSDDRIIGAVTVNRDVSERERTRILLEESEARFLSAFKSAPAGMSLTALDGSWLDLNDAMCTMTGYSREELMNLTFQAITHPDDLTLNLEYFEKILSGEISSYAMEKRYIHKTGRVIWVNVSVTLIRKKGGEPAYFISQAYDITPRKEAEEQMKTLLQEKEIILHEVHHRIKNNMSTMASLLALQASYSTDQSVAGFFREAIGRIRSMGILYDKLYRTDDARHLDIEGYLGDLVDEIRKLHLASHVKIQMSIDKSVCVPPKNISSVGIIVNELLTNGIKYAFPGHRPGTIKIHLVPDSGLARLIYEDDGVGIATDRRSNNSTFGMTLISLLTRQLKGGFTIEDPIHGTGTRMVLTFPQM